MKLKNIAYLLLLSLLWCSKSSYAQTKRNVLAPLTLEKLKSSLHSAKEWKPFPKTPAQWKAKFSDTVLSKIVKAGEELLKEPYPQTTASISLDYLRKGDSKARYEPLMFKRRSMLWTLSLAESVEGKGRFTDKVMDGIWAICEETFWGSTSILNMQKKGVGLPDASEPVVDLYAAETAALLAWVDYFNGEDLDKISKLLRERIRYEVNRRVFEPMLTAQYFYLKSETPNNWAPWIMSNYINAQLLLEDDADKRAKAIHFGVRITDKYINGLGAEGSSDEGHGYWGQSVGCVFDELALLHGASGGKLSVYDHPYLQKMSAYIYKVNLGGNNYFNIGDAIPGSSPDVLMLYRIGKVTKDQDALNFASYIYHTFETKSNTFDVTVARNSKARALYNMETIPALQKQPFTIPKLSDTWMGDVEIMTAKADNGLVLAANGGHNGQNHNHNDVGSFLVYADARPFIIDVGPGAYMKGTFGDKRYTLWFNTSEYHNLPIINGYGQAPGKEYTSTEVKYQKGSNSYLSLNIASTYPKEAGVTNWTRKLNLDRTTNIITITEVYELKNPGKSLALSFMSATKIDSTEPGKIIFRDDSGTAVLMQYNASEFSVNKEKMPLNNPQDKVFKSRYAGKDIWRVQLIAKTVPSKKTITYTFQKLAN